MNHRTIFPIFFLLTATVFLSACGPAPAAEESTENDLVVQLRCEEVGEDFDLRHYAIYTILDDSKVKLAEIHACDTLLPAQYAERGIPEEALTAVGGWYAGFGDYVYAIEEEDGVTFYLGGIGEGQEEPIYSALAKYIDGQFQILRPLHEADLAGYYTHATADSAFVLFVGMQGDELSGKLFGREGQLPESKELLRELGNFAAGPDFSIECLLLDLHFFSPLGDGIVSWEPDQTALVFQDFRATGEEISFVRLDP